MTTASQTDAEIQQAVLRELERDPRVGPMEVGIEVDEGVVTLTGTGQARYAERIASRVDVAVQDGKATLAGRRLVV
jgi:osmotically-inducible protein OsmY